MDNTVTVTPQQALNFLYEATGHLNLSRKQHSEMNLAYNIISQTIQSFEQANITAAEKVEEGNDDES